MEQYVPLHAKVIHATIVQYKVNIIHLVLVKPTVYEILKGK